MADNYVEYKTPQQSNITFGETIKMTTKSPAVADRIFETYAQANSYVKDQRTSACAGLIVSVINDGARNGIYFVNYIQGQEPELRLYAQGSSQSDWLEDDPELMSYIWHRPTTDFGSFYISAEGVVTETPYEDGFMDA